MSGFEYHDVAKLIQVGKIHEISNMTPHQLLQLLLEYSGVTQHDQRIQEVRTILRAIDDRDPDRKSLEEQVESKLRYFAERVENF